MRFTALLGPTARIMAPRLTSSTIRPLHQTTQLRQDKDSSDGNFMDGLAGGSAKGRTGGGDKLDASSDNAPPKPKVTNQSIPGDLDSLSEEQQREVDEHNRDFDKKHDRGNTAPGDKVDKNFWSGEGHGEKHEGNGDAKPPKEKS
ncbi:hypothetical protein FZEAL_7722 [Fusarium zealandicum]|uniref:Uncharacterized protein n=1 Tax=Fusarium zealandicum TaxID=1053134 RepID=A0A8H4XHI5_9HYPO|nr:hypothetical protein FZEAL_7722 [Fusarium zealandicum]